MVNDAAGIWHDKLCSDNAKMLCSTLGKENRLHKQFMYTPNPSSSASTNLTVFYTWYELKMSISQVGTPLLSHFFKTYSRVRDFKASPKRLDFVRMVLEFRYGFMQRLERDSYFGISEPQISGCLFTKRIIRLLRGALLEDQNLKK